MKLKTPKFPSKGHHEAAPPFAGLVTPDSSLAPEYPPPMAASPQVVAEPVSPLKKATSGLAAPTRQRNVAVMIAGAAFIILAAALAASVAASFDDSIDVLVAAREIAEGQPVSAQDFRAVKIAAGAGDIQAVSPDSLGALVGRVAAGPIGQGSMIHPRQFTVGADEAKVVLGAALGPDQYPASGLKPGDRINLIEVGNRFDSENGGYSAGRELTTGEITEVVRLSDALHFSIRVDESISSVVAERIAQDRLTIALLDDSRVLEPVEPLRPASPVVPLELEEAPAE